MPREVFDEPRLGFFQWLNPVVAICDLVRDPLFNNRMWDGFDLLVVLVWSAILWVIACVISWLDGRNVVFRL
jgi:ABC-type polysaccharide/polyol phosphate export permease